MDRLFDINRSFEYENGFYATASAARFSKFVSHLEFFKQTSELRGEIIECGVFKGNSLFRWIKFRDMLENTFTRKIIGFDIFGEFPATEFEDDKKRRELFIEETDGGIGISEKELNDLLNKQGLNKNVHLFKGDICKTVPEFNKDCPELKISLLHLDVDIYEPTKMALEEFYPKVEKGGVIILDDYGSFAGANKAVDDYFNGDVEVKRLPYSNAIGYIVK